MKRIKESVSSICNSANKTEFAPLILEHLEKYYKSHIMIRLYNIARKTCSVWEESERKRLAQICLDNLYAAFNGYANNGDLVATSNSAILVLSSCGTKEQLDLLAKLHDKPKFKMSCLYSHAKTKTQIDWVVKLFEEDWSIALVLQLKASTLQHTLYAVGLALSKDGREYKIEKNVEENVVDKILKLIESRRLTIDEFRIALISLGRICDTRLLPSIFEESLQNKVIETIDNLDSLYTSLFLDNILNTRIMAKKMLCGEELTQTEEDYLLTKLDLC